MIERIAHLNEFGCGPEVRGFKVEKSIALFAYMHVSLISQLSDSSGLFLSSPSLQCLQIMFVLEKVSEMLLEDGCQLRKQTIMCLNI